MVPWDPPLDPPLTMHTHTHTKKVPNICLADQVTIKAKQISLELFVEYVYQIEIFCVLSSAKAVTSSIPKVASQSCQSGLEASLAGTYMYACQYVV